MAENDDSLACAKKVVEVAYLLASKKAPHLPEPLNGGRNALIFEKAIAHVLSDLIEKRAPVYAHVVLARAVLEQASRAWWLFEPGIGLRLRVARGMNDRIFGLAQQDRLPLPQRDPARASERVKDLLADAERFGFELVLHRPTNVRYLEEVRPGQTQLIKALLGAPDGDASLGGFVYGLFSAVAHGTAFGLMQSVKAAPHAPRPPGVQWGEVYTDSGDVVHVLGAVILGTGEALERGINCSVGSRTLGMRARLMRFELIQDEYRQPRSRTQ